MSNPIIVLDYSFTPKDGLQQLADVGITDLLLEDYMWRDWESQRDAPDWGPMDRWVNDCMSLNIHPIIRFRGTPLWAIDEWFLKDANGKEPPNGRECFSPWCDEATACVKERLRWIGDRYKGLNVTINPPQPQSERWIYQGDSGAVATRDIMYCHDRHAVKSFADYRYGLGRTPIDLPSSRDMNNCTDVDAFTDMVVWSNTTLHNYWEELYIWCADALDQHEAYAGWCLFPPTYFNDPYIALTGWINQEDWMESLRVMLAERGCSFYPMVYGYFWWVESPHYEWALLAYPIYHVRRFGWQMYVGAQGATNIVENSQRAIELGLQGLVVGSPFDGRFETANGVSEIGKAVEMWKASSSDLLPL